MRNLPMRFLAMAAALLLAAPSASHAAEGSLDPAARPIETFYAALVDTMKHGEQLGLQGRFRQLTPVVVPPSLTATCFQRTGVGEQP